ncbi:hypothetical protein Pan181_09720 [Aeoliella mucimassa]|uniref:Uncharacterized protein n=1 Tax=Aeoliella mucimassa TaxID=2527972 RepID=A0A518AJ88_9BACT|nr:hypothetical protein Pan181_09720 [Aeoliella mucimassa]
MELCTRINRFWLSCTRGLGDSGVFLLVFYCLFFLV